MSRWHHPFCDTPSVFVQAGLPYCKSCGKSPDINKLIIEQADVKPPWTIPPDEKPGELRLRWPASVIRNSPAEVSTETSTTTTSKQFNVESSIHAHPSLAHPIYTRRLDDTEFRVLSISPAIDEDCPIHAVLGDYQIDSCPEYETVSYCWGGEDGDARQNRPVYVGDYWDVLLQTKNCWSMLQYIRLESHTRLIWIDAICINQNDNLEKETQVPLMGRIYWRCLRAIIYLGEDVVKPKGLFPTKGRLYPKRYDFTEFEDLIPNSIMSREQIFELEYFQRLWVIQEVILAPLAVIPAHGYEFRVRAGTNLPPWKTRSDDISHPWMDYACTGSVSESLSYLLQQTRSSVATDPRDKVYGILGLGLQVEGFKPDYSISRLHTYIGTILHLVVVEQCVEILTVVSDHQSGSNFPSWLPDWSLEEMGKRLLSVSQTTRNISECIPSERDNTTFGNQINYLDNDYFTLLNSVDDTVPPKPGFTASELWAIERPSIDPTTLKLTLPLIHVCKFSSALVKVGRIKNSKSRFNEHCHVFSIEAAGYKLVVCIPDTADDISVEAGDNELFLLQKTQHVNFVLFMRRLSVDGEYRMLRCTICYDLFLSNRSSGAPVENRLAKLSGRTRRSNTGSSILDETVTRVQYRIGARFKQKSNQNNVERHILNLFKQVVYESETSLLDSYVSFLLSFHRYGVAWSEPGMAYMELRPSQLISSCKFLGLIPHEFEIEVFVPSKTAVDGSGVWKMGYLSDSWIREATGYKGHLSNIMRFRVCADKLRGYFRWSHYVPDHFLEWNCNRILQNAESILTSTGPWNTPDAFCYYPWPESFFKEGQIPGRICQVTIV